MLNRLMYYWTLISNSAPTITHKNIKTGSLFKELVITLNKITTS